MAAEAQQYWMLTIVYGMIVQVQGCKAATVDKHGLYMPCQGWFQIHKYTMQKTMENSNKPNKKPDEQGSVHVQAHVRIHDPETKQVHLDQRA